MLLTILLPTYNRENELRTNIESLCGFIRRLSAAEKVGILVSDNCSTDDTESMVHALICEYSDIKIEYSRNAENLGIDGNLVKVVQLCKSQYGMYLGDDDYIDFNYLKKVLELLSNDEANCIIPSYYNIDVNGQKTGRSRDLNTKSQLYAAGFDNCLTNSWRAHQMSGLVFQTSTVCDAINTGKIENMYPQILVIACSCLAGKTYLLTDHPVAVTRPAQSKKAWGYGPCGLIPDIFENYKLLPGITMQQRSKLERKLVLEQYWRVAMYLKLGLREFLSCIRGIQNSPNTTRRTAKLFPAIVFDAFFRNGFKLLFSGQLFDTLRTKVDIKE